MNALITGTSSGLGRDLARAFVDDDPSHVVIGLTKNADDDTDLEWDLGRWEDETGINSTPRLIQSLRAHIGRVTKQRTDAFQFDALIHCAGINDIRHFEEVTHGFLRQLMTVNAFAPVLLTQALHNDGLLSKDCRIVLVTSDASWRAMRHSLAYNMSKAAADMAAKQMARELTKLYGYSIFSVRPGKMSGTGMSRQIDKRVETLRGWTAAQAAEYASKASVTGIETPSHVVAEHIYQLVTSPIARHLSGTGQDLAG